MRRRVGGDDLHGIAAVGYETGVERIIAIGEVVLQQQPARFAVAAVVDGVDQLIVVIVMRRPANANRIAVADSGRWRIEARLPLSLSLPGRLAAAYTRNRLIVIAGLHSDVVNFRSNIFGQVIQEDGVNARSGIAGMEHGLPL